MTQSVVIQGRVKKIKTNVAYAFLFLLVGQCGNQVKN